MSKRYRAESQGTSRHLWNVLDTRTSYYMKRLVTREEALRLARELNQERRTHKCPGPHGNEPVACGVYLIGKYGFSKCTRRWVDVTCKACLKSRWGDN